MVCGPAFTVQAVPGDNFWIHRAIYAAHPGDVLTVDTGNAPESGYWGELMTCAAMEAGLEGLVMVVGDDDGSRWCRPSGCP